MIIVVLVIVKAIIIIRLIEINIMTETEDNNKFTTITCKLETKAKIASLGIGKETWDDLLESLYLKMKGGSQVISIVLHDDQIKWINEHNVNLSAFVQDSLDEWMYEAKGDEGRGVRAKIDERRLQSMKAFSEE